MLDVITNQGDRGQLAWQYPGEEPASGSQLLVRPGEKAVLLGDDGRAECFAVGRHTLTTSRLPLLHSLLRLPFGGQSPYRAELWYVNVGERLEIKWGTDTPIHLWDTAGRPLSLRGYGLLGMQVINPALFLAAFRGQAGDFNKKTLAALLYGKLAYPIRESLAACYAPHGEELFQGEGSRQQATQQQAARQQTFARLLVAQLEAHVSPILAEYGLVPATMEVSDLWAAGEGDGSPQLALSALSVVLPGQADTSLSQRDSGTPLLTTGAAWRGTMVAASFLLLFLLLLVLGLLLPPRQTVDFAGIAFAVLAHFTATSLVLWLTAGGRGFPMVIGGGVVAAFYWLGSVGVALVFRLLALTSLRLLVVLQLGLACVAALVLLAFWRGDIQV